MKNLINNVVVASAVTLFAANVNADSIHAAISNQVDVANTVVETSMNKGEPRVSIQDYVEAARSADVVQTSDQTAAVRALSGVSNAL